jgi:hypothetical protein
MFVVRGWCVLCLLIVSYAAIVPEGSSMLYIIPAMNTNTSASFLIALCS